MNDAQTSDEGISAIRDRFLALTGLLSIDTREQAAGPETFLHLLVGRDTPLYRQALAQLDHELPSDNPFHGRLLLDAENKQPFIESKEVDLLRSLITRSLRVTSNAAEAGFLIDFVPFRGGEERQVVQPANHAILGRRGVGKSSLILLANRRVLRDGHVPVWLDMQAYHRRSDARAAVEVLADVFEGAVRSTKKHFSTVDTAALESGLTELERQRDLIGDGLDAVRRLVPQLHRCVRRFTSEGGRNLFVFLDDAHLLGTALQPSLFDLVHSVLKGAGGWLKIAGVKNLLQLYAPVEKVGLQQPGDIQLVPLDLTLEHPATARDHLSGILGQFLLACGVKRITEIIPNSAIDRLVWCSAGVARDFLSLFERSVAFAKQHRRNRVGVQEVNLAVGEFGQEKIRELEQDVGDGGAALQETLDRLQTAVLDEHKRNSFLIQKDIKHEGYKALQKLVDLRLVHLIQPSITPDHAGVRYEAYLLDYSFYTGVRRRHGLSELKIGGNEPPKWAELRRLPKIHLDDLVGVSAMHEDQASSRRGAATASA